MSIPQIISLLEFCLTNTYFLFQGKYYEQVQGAAIGSLISPLIANIFMELVIFSWTGQIFVDWDKLLLVTKHGFLRSEENVFPVILNTHKVYGKMCFFIISNIYVWLVLLPYM